MGVITAALTIVAATISCGVARLVFYHVGYALAVTKQAVLSLGRLAKDDNTNMLLDFMLDSRKCFSVLFRSRAPALACFPLHLPALRLTPKPAPKVQAPY